MLLTDFKPPRLLFACTLSVLAILGAFAQSNLKLSANPKEYAESMINKPSFVENAKGENFCWHARVGMDQFLENYELTKNTEWLD
ncbi:MAG: hypothetical protein WA874_06730, partial [Chryseosolibacter sp.]